MASRIYDIRYSNEIKRYGLFATEQIPIGTKILQEWSVMTKAQPINDIVKWLINNSNVTEIPMPEVMISDFKIQSQRLLDGMSDLQKRVKDNEKYDTAMNIHNMRMKEDNIYNYDTEDGTVHHPYVELPMELYKRATTEKGAQPDDVLTIILQRPLQQINTYLYGAVEVQYPENQAWGPITSLINHGCSPNSLVSSYAEPDPEEASLRNVGVVALYATKTIEAGEEISIEYASVFGTLEHRRKELRSYGIQKCLCSKCETEADLMQKSTNSSDPLAKEELRTLMNLNVGLHVFFAHTITRMPTFTPAAYFQCLHTILTSLSVANDHGGSAMTRLYINAVDFAKHHNDNVRVYWFTQQLLGRIQNAYGPSHQMLDYFVVNFHFAALGHTVWNESRRDMLSLVNEWTISDADTDLVFMQGCDNSSSAYQQLAVTSEGHLEKVSYAENLLRARSALAMAAITTTTAGDDHEDDDDGTSTIRADVYQTEKGEEKGEDTVAAAAAEAANAAALALTAAEDREEEKKAKATAKKREKERKRKEKKRIAAAAAAPVVDAAVAAAAAAVTDAATVVAAAAAAAAAEAAAIASAEEREAREAEELVDREERGDDRGWIRVCRK